MTARHSLTREEAARLLGLEPDAGLAEVRRAFRLWAAWAHPDHGGSAERFARLCAARDRLLEPTGAANPPAAPAAPPPASSGDPAGGPRPRRSWRDVLRRPAPHVLVLLALGFAVAVSVVLMARLLPMPWGAVPPALASAAWCVAISKSLLHGADHGHVIVTRSVAWASVMAGQLLLAAAAGVPLIEALPLLALPFVAVIAAVNPTAGLWQSGSR